MQGQGGSNNRHCQQQQGPQATAVYMGVRDQQQQEGDSSKNNGSGSGSVREGRVLHARAGAEAVVGKDGWWRQKMGRVEGVPQGSGVKASDSHTHTNERIASFRFIHSSR